MSTILGSDDRQDFLSILVEVFDREPYNNEHHRNMLLKDAGLEDIVSGIDLSGSGPAVADRLISNLEGYGPLPDRPDTLALGALLSHLLTLELERSEAEFIAYLIVEHHLVEDSGYLSRLRREYVGMPAMVGERKGGTRSILESRGIDDGPEAREPAPRYANVGLFDDPTALEARSEREPLAVETLYYLRINIGDLEVWDTDRSPTPFKNPYKSERIDKGHWLDVIVTSDEFLIEQEQFAIFLPEVGESWVCDCERISEHHCKSSEREEYLHVPVRTRPLSGRASLRVGFYFKNNLLQCRLFTAWVGTKVPDGEKGYESVTDYTLTRSFANVGNLPARTLNIFTNENADGSHRVVTVGTSDDLANSYIRCESLNLDQTEKVLERARRCLLAIHWEVNEPPKLVVQPDGEEYVEDIDMSTRLQAFEIDGKTITNAKEKPAFIKDLENLAEVGWWLWDTLFSGDEENLNLLREKAVIQISRADNSSPLLFPWAVIYDIPLIGGPEEWEPCPLLKPEDDAEWKWAPGRPLVEPGSGQSHYTLTRCPKDDGHNHRSNVICPFGFWGFRHIIGQPLSRKKKKQGEESHDQVPGEIVVSGEQAEMLVGYSQSLGDSAEQHVKDLRDHLKKLQLTIKDSKNEIFEKMGDRGLEFVYFYCHGLWRKVFYHFPNNDDRKYVPQELDADKCFIQVGEENAKITPSDITGLRLTKWTQKPHWDVTSPLIFLNGCHTVEITPKQTVTFVDTFNEANASGVIGTEITVHKDLASQVALLFFCHLLEEDGRDVGEAIRRMRLDLLSRGNVLGLAYTPYCSADLKLKVE